MIGENAQTNTKSRWYHNKVLIVFSGLRELATAALSTLAGQIQTENSKKMKWKTKYKLLTRRDQRCYTSERSETLTSCLFGTRLWYEWSETTE